MPSRRNIPPRLQEAVKNDLESYIYLDELNSGAVDIDTRLLDAETDINTLQDQVATAQADINALESDLTDHYAADDHTHYHTDARGDARYLMEQHIALYAGSEITI